MKIQMDGFNGGVCMLKGTSLSSTLLYNDHLDRQLTTLTVSVSTWVMKTRLIEKKIPIIFLKPSCQKLQNISKNVSFKIGNKGPQNLSQIFKNG